MRRALAVSVIAILLAAAPADSTQPPAPAARGFTVAPDERGAWSFVTPTGERLISLGVNHVSPKAWSPRPNTRFYNAIENQFNGDAAAWANSSRRILLDAGFNTLGAWTRPQMTAGDGLYHTIVLYVAGTEMDRCLNPLRPGFEDLVRTNTREMMAQYGQREWLLGVFLDNEAPWWGKTAWDRIATFTLLERAFQLPPEDPARQGALAFLQKRHASPVALGEAYGQPLADWSGVTLEYLQSCTTPAAMKDRADFTTMLADLYYDISARVVRKELPGVLILGTRFAGDAPDGVIIATGRNSDVVSFNAYVNAPASPSELIARYWMLTRRPLMLTEFSWRARENTSGNPNSRGAGTVVATQADRAANYRALIMDLMTEPVIIGAHWFEFADQSPEGRFDGENSNYGIVDINHNPYRELLGVMGEVNRKVPAIRAGQLRPTPTEMPKPRAVTYTPGQHPGRPPTLDLLASPASAPEAWNAPDAAFGVESLGDALVLTYDAGTQWGGGVNLFGPASLTLASAAPSTDLDGYTHIVLELTAPKGITLNVSLHEAGSAEPGLASYPSAGDDGESFISDPFFGTGEPMTRRIPISELRAQIHWGNQRGLRRIDMNAVKTIGLQVQGAPQRGTVRIDAFRLER